MVSQIQRFFFAILSFNATKNENKKISVVLNL